VRLGLIFVVVAAVFGAPTAASAHVVYGSPTLWQLVREADVVVDARIEDPARIVAQTAPPLRRRVVTATPLAVLKGELPPGELDFVPHGHGVAEYARHERVLLFLRRIERVRELATTPLAGALRWGSTQESTDKMTVGAGDDPFRAAARAYVAVEQVAGAARLDALRRVTFRLLASREPRLAASAVRDVAMAGEVPLVRAADVPALAPLIADPRVAIGTRIALLAELERRRLVAGPERWARLIGETSGREQLAVVRAAAAHPSPEVTAALLALLDADPGVDIAAAAAVALGTPGNDAAVATLGRTLADEDARLRMAAIRALGRIGTPPARESLAVAASFHPDPGTRRRANAEVVVLGGGRQQGVAPMQR
jgi:hypothetical protein